MIRTSDFFKTATKEIWLNKKTEELFPVIEMLDDVPVNFSIYADWLYSGLIFNDDMIVNNDHDTEFHELALAYILGEKLLDKHFKNAVIDAFIEKVLDDLVIDVELSRLIYDNTPPGSQLRRLLADIYAYHGEPTWMEASSANETLDSEFVFDLSLAQLANRNLVTRVPPYMLSKCYYHQHENILHRCLPSIRGTNFNPRRKTT